MAYSVLEGQVKGSKPFKTEQGVTVDLAKLEKAVELVKMVKIAGNTDGGVVRRDGTYGRGTGSCHAWIARINNGLASSGPTVLPEVMFSKWMGARTKENDLYFDWITSPVSPWRSAFPPEHLLVNDEDISSLEFMRSYGFIFWHINKLPANVQHQFLIATRIPTQHPIFIKNWHTLVTEFNFDPAFAFIWSAMIADYTDLSLHRKGRETPHPTRPGKTIVETCSIPFFRGNMAEFNFDTWTSSEQSVLNFCLGRMDKERFISPYSESTVYYPVNILWGNNAVKPDKNYYSYLQKNYAGKGQTKNGSQPGSFSNDTVLWYLSFNEYIEMGKLENDRLRKEIETIVVKTKEKK